MESAVPGGKKMANESYSTPSVQKPEHVSLKLAEVLQITSKTKQKCERSKTKIRLMKKVRSRSIPASSLMQSLCP